ncbi:MAG TPA: MGMT family protein [Thermoplasmata archaeon]|nr:MGMT family protein [Thermoplasmata archaeon]
MTAVLARFRDIIARVPRGRVITYGAVAAAAGHPRAARLTVWALHRYPGLPWHRVVAAGGRIALRGEEGAEQQLRLKLEGVTFRGDRVRMERHAWTPRASAASPQRSPSNAPRTRPAMRSRGDAGPGPKERRSASRRSAGHGPAARPVPS